MRPWTSEPLVRNMRRDPHYSPIPSRIVVRGTNWLGDTIMSLPAAKEIRRIFSSAIIAFWAPSSLVGLIESAEVADYVIPFDRNSGGPAMRPLRMRAKLAAERFDLAVLLQNAFESAFTAWLARVPLRAGYPTDLRGPFLNIAVPLARDIRTKHQVFYYLGITDFLERHFFGRAGCGNQRPDCSIPLNREMLDRAKALLIPRGVDLTRPLVSLCPGSVNSEAKRWPADYFARLADLLADHVGADVVFLGAPEEKGLIDGILAAVGRARAVNLAGVADMVTSMGVMHLSRLVISNDTGSAHLAVASSAAVLTLFGPTSAAATAPYGPNAHVIQGEAPCAPCRHYRCPVPGHPCMRSITPEAVLRRTEEIADGRDSPKAL